MIWLETITLAHAGSGPWVVGERALTVYTGIESQQIGRLAIQTSAEQRDVIDVAEGVSTLGVKAIGTLGLGPRVDVQFVVPWYSASTSRRDHPLCVTLGLGACETTRGLGIIESRVKVLALDELFGPPLSFSFGLDARFGQFTADTRERLTNLGEGTFDVGPFLAIGRTRGLGRGGFWSGWLEAGFRYRMPNNDDFPQFDGQRAVPGPEWTSAAELLVGPVSSFAFGPTAHALLRPFGFDWYQVDLADPDRFAALNVANVRVGATVVVRQAGTALSMSVLQTVYGRNNPSDVFVFGLGLQFDGSLRRARDE